MASKKKHELGFPTGTIDSFDDTWKDGNPINIVSFDGLLVRFTLPNGDRLLATTLDYNRGMKAIYGNENKWRNGINLKKRKKMGLTDSETQELNNWVTWWKTASKPKEEDE